MPTTLSPQPMLLLQHDSEETMLFPAYPDLVVCQYSGALGRVAIFAS